MSRTYDPANRVLTHTFADGNIMEWVYDDRNVVTEVKYDGDSVLNQIHDPGYRCTNQSFGNGLDRTIAFGRQDNLRTNDKVEDTGVIDDLNFDYTYAADKNVLTETSPNGVLQDLGFTATYDPGNRVANWTRADQYPGARETQSWNYDDAGNWNSTTIDGNQLDRTNNSSDEATEIDGDPLSYDSRGNLTEDETGQTYKWDIDNRLKQVDGAGDRIYYKYDVFGRRVYQKKGTDKEALLWWGKEEYAEHRQIASKPVIQNDLHAHPNGLNTTFGRALEGDKNDIQYFHKNYLDHVYAVSDDNGNVIEQYRYSAFGEVEVFDATGIAIASTAIDNDILWNVKRLDWDTGLYMYLYRHYDPAHGRWMSRDPIGEYGGVNLYGFVGNIPLIYIDFLGLELIKYEIGAVAAEGEYTSDLAGFVTCTWNNTILHPNQFTSRVEKVKGSNRYKVVHDGVFALKMYLNSKFAGGPNFTDQKGNTPLQHEKHHEKLYAKYWNEFVANVSKSNGMMCKKKCAENLKSQAEVLHDIYKAKARRFNKEFDIQSYDPTSSEVAAKIKALQGEVAAIINEHQALLQKFDQLVEEAKKMKCEYELSESQ